MNEHRFMQLAKEAMTHAYAPYSNFHVGACAVDEQGKYALGCNVENASYGACLCAERAAIGAAVANGLKRITAIYITSDGDLPTFPCGICRQVLLEMNPEMDVYVSSRDDSLLEHHTISELLPHAFVKANLP